MRMTIKRLCLASLLIGFTATANAAATFISGVSQASGWLDVNKANPRNDDTELCWAASSSNILAFSGWGGGTNLTTNTQIFADYKSYWSDQPGHPYYGVEWWFNGTNQKQGTAGWAQ